VAYGSWADLGGQFGRVSTIIQPLITVACGAPLKSRQAVNLSQLGRRKKTFISTLDAHVRLRNITLMDFLWTFAELSELNVKYDQCCLRLCLSCSRRIIGHRVRPSLSPLSHHDICGCRAPLHYVPYPPFMNPDSNKLSHDRKAEREDRP
jgi:hypothetical protein